MLHVAIHAYAHDRVEWRTKNGNAWKSIGSFFTSEKSLDEFCPQALNAPPAETANDRNPQYANPDAPINTDWQGTGRATFQHVWDQVQRRFAIVGSG